MRLSLVGTMILSLLAGPSVGAVAQTEVDGSLGAVFVERNGEDPPTYYAFHGDGTVFCFSPYWGPGVGVWEPGEDGSIAATVVHTDVDGAIAGEERGTATMRSVSTFDAATDTLAITWDATLEPADGGPPSTIDGSASAERRVMAPMPPEESVATPPDTGWQPVIGLGRHDGGRGSVQVEFDDYEIYDINHADGTSVSFNPYAGDGVGLWAPMGEVGIGSFWAAPAGPDEAAGVAKWAFEETTGWFGGPYGTSEAYEDRMYGNAMRLGRLLPDGTLPADPDPAAWPDRGSVWIERHEGGSPILMVMHADGTVVRLDPNGKRVPPMYEGYQTFAPLSGISVSAGLWRPTEDGGFVFATQHLGYDPLAESARAGKATRTGTGRIAEDGETLTYEYLSRWVTSYAGDAMGSLDPQESSDTASATRLHLEP